MKDKDTIKEMRDMISSWKDRSAELFDNFKQTCNICSIQKQLVFKMLTNIDTKSIEIATIDDLKQVYEAVTNTRSSRPSLYESWLERIEQEDDESEKETFEEFFRKFLLSLKTQIDEIEGIKTNIEHCEGLIKEVEREIAGYLFSNEYVERRDKKFREELEFRKKDLEVSADVLNDVEKVKHKKIIKEIEQTRTLYSLKYLIPDNPKAIVDTFFDNTKNDYVYQRATKNLSRLNMLPSAFNVFSNLEERFFEPEYHPFNNFFLFSIVRMIGYINPEDKFDEMKVKIAVQAMLALVSDPDNCGIVKDRIHKFYELFMPYRDEFARRNTLTSKNSSEIDEEIVGSYYEARLPLDASYIKTMLLLEPTITKPDEVDIFIKTTDPKTVCETAEKIRILIATHNMDGEAIGINALLKMDLNVMREEKAAWDKKMKEESDEAIAKKQSVDGEES